MKKLRLLLLVLILGSFSLFSQIKNEIVGKSDYVANNLLSNKGYVLTHTSNMGDTTYEYWWNSSKKECLCSEVTYNKVSGSFIANKVDCNQKEVANSTVKKNNGAAIAGAAAIIGAAILLNKSNHHKDKQHYKDDDMEAAFERGYRDGLYHRTYHSPYGGQKKMQAYTDGYYAGKNQRNINTHYHSDNRDYNSGYSNNNQYGTDYNYGRYSRQVNVFDLKNKYAPTAYNKMRNRGFKEQKEYFNDAKRLTVWYNRETSQCVKLVELYDKIINIRNSDQCTPY